MTETRIGHSVITPQTIRHDSLGLFKRTGEKRKPQRNDYWLGELQIGKGATATDKREILEKVK